MEKYVLAILIIIGITGYYLFSFVPFQPLEFKTSGDEGYHMTRVSDDFYNNLSIVLDRYKVAHQLKDGKILIRRTTSFDRELIWNYTTKAIRLGKDSVKVANGL